MYTLNRLTVFDFEIIEPTSILKKSGGSIPTSSGSSKGPSPTNRLRTTNKQQRKTKEDMLKELYPIAETSTPEAAGQDDSPMKCVNDQCIMV
jgi:hypothetical protein